MTTMRLLKKSTIQVAIISLLLLILAIISYNLIQIRRIENRLAEQQRDVGLLKLARIIERITDTNDDFQKAIGLRNHIYRNVPRKQTPKNFNFNDINLSYHLSTRDPQVGHICGGLAIIYLTALESQGIPARYVALYSKDIEPFDSHATVEFWYRGRWHASDPTFNVMFMHNGEYLSYSELYDLRGEEYEVVSNGYPVFQEEAKNLENYYIELDDLMSYMIIHPAEVWSGGKWFQYPMELYPEWWDGGITYKNGRRDVRNFLGIYKYLFTGPLR